MVGVDDPGLVEPVVQNSYHFLAVAIYLIATVEQTSGVRVTDGFPQVSKLAGIGDSWIVMNSFSELLPK